MNPRELARALGSLGGRSRATRLSADEKKRVASLGGKARLQSLQAARRIADNFRYAAVVDELRGRRTKVKRMARYDGPLPGIYLTSLK
jgi:hypothetical protein